MESFLEWLTIAVTKALGFPFLASYTKLKRHKQSELLDLGQLGDNVPFVFIRNSHTG